MEGPSPLTPIPPSPYPAASTSDNTHASKGKAREEPPIAPEIPQAAPPVAEHTYALRGTKRRAAPDSPTGPADGSPRSPIGEEEEVTPRKGDVPQGGEVPQVHVDSPSPTRPTRRPRTDDGGAGATGDASLPITVPSITHTYLAARTCVVRAGPPIGRSAGHRLQPGVQQPRVSFVIKRRSPVILLRDGPCPSLKQSVHAVGVHSLCLLIC